MFAVLASIMNIGLAVSDLGGAWLTTIFDVHTASEGIAANYENLDKIMWIAILSSFLPLPLLRFLPETRVSGEVTGGPSSQAQPVPVLEPGKQEIA